MRGSPSNWPRAAWCRGSSSSSCSPAACSRSVSRGRASLASSKLVAPRLHVIVARWRDGENVAPLCACSRSAAAPGPLGRGGDQAHTAKESGRPKPPLFWMLCCLESTLLLGPVGPEADELLQDTHQSRHQEGGVTVAVAVARARRAPSRKKQEAHEEVASACPDPTTSPVSQQHLDRADGRPRLPSFRRRLFSVHMRGGGDPGWH